MNYNDIDLKKMESEIKIKEERIRGLLAEKLLDGIIISKNYNFAWMTAGGNNKIVHNLETGASEMLITDSDKYILTNNLEAKRLREEEVFGAELNFLKRKWYQDKSLDNLISGLKLGSDLATKEMEYVGDELARIRYSLTEFELERYRGLGREVAEIVTEVCYQLSEGVTENQVAGLLAKNLWEKGIYPVSMLVAADERIAKYSHPQPTNKSANNRILISLAVQRRGLIVSLSRMVSLKSLSYQLLEDLDDLIKIESVYLNGTSVGQLTGELFTKVVNKYQELGYEKEWEYNDHGGALGYRARDYLVSKDCQEKIKLNQPFAWTPTLPGLKLEDTIVATESGLELITIDDRWPMKRPEILLL
jgi:Xaa-Pro aminopeptidase